MKKNLLSVLILALLIVNLILTTIMMVNVTQTNKKTAELVGNIAAVLNLELDSMGTEEVVPMEQLEVYDLSAPMTIPLLSQDGKNHYVVCNISFSLNNKGEGYKDFGGEKFASYESLIKDAIEATVSQYTVEEVNDNEKFEVIREEILKSVKALFVDKNEFIYKVAISERKTQ